MRFVVISKLDEGLGLAYRLGSEGHRVSFYTLKTNATYGEGLVECLHFKDGRLQDALVELLKIPADVYLVTDPSLVEVADGLRLGITKVFGPTGEGELNDSTYTITMFFDGLHLWNDVFISTRDTRFLAGGLGPKTEGESVTTWHIFKKDCGELGPVEDAMKASGFKGIFSFGEDNLTGPWEVAPYYFTHLDILYTICELSKRTLAEIVSASVTGNQLTLACGRVACCATLSIPPYPYGKQLKERTFSLHPDAVPHVWLRNVYQDDEGVLHTGNGSGVVLHASAYDSLRADGSTGAGRRVLRTLHHIELEDKQYRIDACRHREYGREVLKVFGRGESDEKVGSVSSGSVAVHAVSGLSDNERGGVDSVQDVSDSSGEPEQESTTDSRSERESQDSNGGTHKAAEDVRDDGNGR